jgi:hypothetical protein
MALQQGMGLLPERRARRHPLDRHLAALVPAALEGGIMSDGEETTTTEKTVSDDD